MLGSRRFRRLLYAPFLLPLLAAHAQGQTQTQESSDSAAPAAASAGAPACAETCPPPPPPQPTPWLGEIGVGVVNTTGNTRTRSVNVRSMLEYRSGPWVNRLTALAFSGSREGLSTDERYSVANKTDHQFGPDNYAFGNLAYDNDRFAGIAERYAVTLGYGRHVLRRERHRLDIEIGAGANRTRDQDDRYETAAIVTVGGRYVWTISPNAEFTQALRTESGVSKVYVNPVSSLKLTVVGNLFATFNHEIRYNSEVPADTRHLDQISTINLGYAFGTPPP